jgi:hypothetical protein
MFFPKIKPHEPEMAPYGERARPDSRGACLHVKPRRSLEMIVGNYALSFAALTIPR